MQPTIIPPTAEDQPLHRSYRMVDDDGRQFDAAIPAFTLAMPGMLH